MRKQYHFRRRGGDVLIWDVDRLLSLAAARPRHRVALSTIRELDEPYWFDATSSAPTCRAVLDHARLVAEADLAHPIILSADGRIMDGMHRVGKAYLEDRSEILAVRFEVDPEPDFVNVSPDSLPY